ncbi:MAG TPA: SBBP repeat-containing protein [Acidobacteriota bacterium]|jgi:photosystem II stability/assembly factor-like uncharacterized protein
MRKQSVSPATQFFALKKNSFGAQKKNSRFKTSCLLAAVGFAIPLYAASDGKTKAAGSIPGLQGVDSATKQRLLNTYANISLGFEPNRGQFSSQIRFAARGLHYSIYLDESGVSLHLPDSVKAHRDPKRAALPRPSTPQENPDAPPAGFRIHFQNANPARELRALDPLPGKSNYLRGTDQRQWLTDIPTHARILYENVYPGISVRFSGDQRRLRSEFLLQPGSDPSRIRVSYEGVESQSLNSAGSLLLATKGQELVQQQITAYQETAAKRREIPARYVLGENGIVQISIEPVDAQLPIIASSTLEITSQAALPGPVYSTLLGGLGDDVVAGVAVDSNGNAYVVGRTDSVDFRGVPIASTRAGTDVFVAKFSPIGTLIYSTIIGGGRDDAGTAIAVDGSGGVVLTGFTASSDWPKVNPTQSTIAGGGGISKTTDGGNRWTDINSGLSNTAVFALAADPINPNVVYAGTLGGVFKTINGGMNWSYVLQSSSSQFAPTFSLAINPSNSNTLYAGSFPGVIYRSADGGSSWARTSLSGVPNIVTALAVDPANTSVVYAGIYGSGVYKSQDNGVNWLNTGVMTNRNVNALAVDPTTPATLYAATSGGGIFKSLNSANTWSAANTGLASRNVYAVAVNPKTPSTVYAGTFGIYKSSDSAATWQASGLPLEFVYAITVNPVSPSTVYAGTTNGVFKSTDSGATWAAVNNGLTFVDVFALVLDPFNPNTQYVAVAAASDDAFVARLNSSGNALLYSSYLGGSRHEVPTGIALDSSGNMYLSGYTDTVDFFGAGGFQRSNAGGIDTFISKLTSTGSTIYSTYLGGSGDDLGLGMALAGNGEVIVTGSTNSLNLPLEKPLRSTNAGGTDVFVSRLNAAGTALIYSTYVGGGGNDRGNAVAVDSSGNAYVTGSTRSTNFPAATPFQAANGGGMDAFVFKLNPTGSALVYSTYLGGSGGDSGNGITIDAAGNAYVTGFTDAVDFPVANAFQPRKSGGVFKSGNAGTAWNFSSNGLSHPEVNALVMDPSDSSILYAGTNGGGVFKSVDAGATWTSINNGLGDLTIYALAVHPSSSSTLYAGTWRGGIYRSINAGGNWTAVNAGLTRNSIYSLAIDPVVPSLVYAGSFNSLVFKTTDGGNNWSPVSVSSQDLSTYSLIIDLKNPNVVYAGTSGGGIFKSNNGGSNWTAFNFGLANGNIYGLAIDPVSTATIYAATPDGVFKSTDGGNSWNAVNNGLGFVATNGFTFSATYTLAVDRAAPTNIYAGTFAGIFKSSNGGGIWAPTAFNGAFIYAPAVLMDPRNANNLYVAGWGGTEAFVSKLNANGSALVYSSFFGGIGSEVGNRIAVDTTGNAYVAGLSASGLISLTNPTQSTFGGGLSDALLFKVPAFDAPVCALNCTATVAAAQRVGSEASFAASATASDCNGPVTYLWNFGDGTPTSNLQNPTHLYTVPGAYNWTLTVRAGDVTCTRSGSINIFLPARRRP